MEIILKEESKNKVTFQIKGESHTLCNILKEELRNDENVVNASYFVSHPDIDEPTFTVETKGVSPKKAILDAVARIKKQNDTFVKAFSKEIR
jgi:DNA-directed RNA polymerase subunit L